MVSSASASSAQQLLDRVAARVDSNVIMLSDVRAAVGLGLVDSGTGPDADRMALEQLIERQVMLGEVARFPAPEPAAAAVDERAAAMAARPGAGLAELMASTGVDEGRIRELARDSLRIQAYVRQRFGNGATLENPEVRLWLRDARARAMVTVLP